MNQTESHWQLFAVISGIYIKSRRITENHLKLYGMTFPQFGALFNLTEQDNITQVQLSEKLLADANTTMVLCNSMERKKWITRNPDPSDKRVNKIVLTDKGRQVFQKTYPLVLNEYKIFTNAITEKEISITLPILSHLYTIIAERYTEIKKMKQAAIIIDSKYGNNEKLAYALSKGLNKSGIETDILKVGEAQLKRLNAYDLFCVGGPTHITRMSNPMKEFISQLKSVNIRGKNGFCFGTRVNSRMNMFDLNGSAKKIESKLKKRGVKMLKPAVNIIVEDREGPLTRGSEKLFQDIGCELGEMING